MKVVPRRQRGFSAFSVAREAWLNLSASLGPSLGVAVVSLVVGAGLPAVAGFEVSEIVRDADQAIAAGTNMMSLTAEDRAPLSASRCDELNNVDGVLTAGGIVSRSAAYAATRPNEPLQLIHGTVGAASALWPMLTEPTGTAGVLVGADTASLFGLSVGSRLMLSESAGTSPSVSVLVDQVAGKTVRDVTLDGAIFVSVAPTGMITECLVEAQPGARQQVEAVLIGWFRADLKVAVSPYFVSNAPGSLPADELRGRLTQYLPALAFVLLFVSLAGYWFARRSELALYRTLGISRPQLLGMLATEALLLVLIPVNLGFALSVFMLVPFAEALAIRVAAADAIRFSALLPLLPLAGFLLVARSIRIDALKGR